MAEGGSGQLAGYATVMEIHTPRRAVNVSLTRGSAALPSGRMQITGTTAREIGVGLGAGGWPPKIAAPPGEEGGLQPTRPPQERPKSAGAGAPRPRALATWRCGGASPFGESLPVAESVDASPQPTPAMRPGSARGAQAVLPGGDAPQVAATWRCGGPSPLGANASRARCAVLGAEPQGDLPVPPRLPDTDSHSIGYGVRLAQSGAVRGPAGADGTLNGSAKIVSGSGVFAVRAKNASLSRGSACIPFGKMDFSRTTGHDVGAFFNMEAPSPGPSAKIV